MTDYEKPTICRYCGGVISLDNAEKVYGNATKQLGPAGEKIYLCQNCNAYVGCHKGTTHPKGKVANNVLRLKRMETHHVFDALWKKRHMSRMQAYDWLAEQMGISKEQAHIGQFEMDDCEKAIRLCRAQKRSGKEAA